MPQLVLRRWSPESSRPVFFQQATAGASPTPRERATPSSPAGHSWSIADAPRARDPVSSSRPQLVHRRRPESAQSRLLRHATAGPSSTPRERAAPSSAGHSWSVIDAPRARDPVFLQQVIAGPSPEPCSRPCHPARHCWCFGFCRSAPVALLLPSVVVRGGVSAEATTVLAAGKRIVGLLPFDSSSQVRITTCFSSSDRHRNTLRAGRFSLRRADGPGQSQQQRQQGIQLN